MSRRHREEEEESATISDQSRSGNESEENASIDAEQLEAAFTHSRGKKATKSAPTKRRKVHSPEREAKEPTLGRYNQTESTTTPPKPKEKEKEKEKEKKSKKEADEMDIDSGNKDKPKDEKAPEDKAHPHKGKRKHGEKEHEEKKKKKKKHHKRHGKNKHRGHHDATHSSESDSGSENASAEEHKKGKRKRTKSTVKRPITGYINFCSSIRAEVKAYLHQQNAKIPEKKNLVPSLTEVSAEFSRRWAALSETEKDVYRNHPSVVLSRKCFILQKNGLLTPTTNPKFINPTEIEQVYAKFEKEHPEELKLILEKAKKTKQQKPAARPPVEPEDKKPVAAKVQH